MSVESQVDTLESQVDTLKYQVDTLESQVDALRDYAKALNASVVDIYIDSDILYTKINNTQSVLLKLVSMLKNRDNPNWSTIYFDQIRDIESSLKPETSSNGN